MAQGTKVFTGAFTTELQIDQSMSIQLLSIMVESGTCQVVGTNKLGNIASTPITLSAGQSLTLPANNASSALDDVTITPSGGTTNIVALQ